MLVRVRVKPNARENKVERSGERLVVSVKAKAVGGKANEALLKLLALYFGVPTSALRIVRGHKGREKVVEVDED